ncbi:Myosin type-2 heavy chain 1 [Komagataella kurtzmanii]|nr:Myosin type-2 heavy chain 1 [Komagataella kurtzmanii]
MSTGTFEVGTRCWIPDEQLGWCGAEVSEISEDNGKYLLTFTKENGESQQIKTSTLEEDNDVEPKLRNPPILEAQEDLTSLSYLNEPSVLNAIKVRYSRLNIYTYSGIVLIATNPFQRVDQLYSPDIIQAYAGKRRGELEPHLFAIAEDAYRCMKTDHENQSIVVSGESGAGKTVSAKYIMRYFASVDSSNHSHNMSDTEKQILATNPIMEAFGNAKTTRNDNSSRFGKYLEILFDENTVIIGARIRTYLLERSRLVFQPPTERNYHIFYQILAGLSKDDKEKLGLTSAEDFHYTNQGGESKIKDVDDAEEFSITSDALSLIGINKDKQFQIYTLLAALLHIGNIELKKTRNDAHLSSDEPSLVKACELLGLDPVNFAKWIVKKQITTRTEKIVSNLNHQQATVAKDSIAKYIYSALFDWLVEYVNSDLCPPEVEANIKSFIGVLDIYGFEHFEKNSFEQFCINYANEKLQQEFNQHVFKLEQEEYVREEIEWSFIEFADNQPCIALIEQKLGILSLLDEESRLPSGDDKSWIEKMYQTLDKEPTNKVFKKPRFGNNKFIVKHYALDVPYDSEGFIEKNRDTVSDGQLETLKASTNELLLEILATVDRNAEKISSNQPSKPGKMMNKKPTLGSIFKNSLIELMKTIDSTNVHYIRCIKPNEEKKAWEFDPVMVLSQLRACGVLETIRISCAGFPSRWTYAEFAQRYHILVKPDAWTKLLTGNADEKAINELCELILKETVDDPSTYQMGNTKVFFKAGMLAKLENFRTEKLHQSAVMIQKHIRRIYHHTRFLRIRNETIELQAAIRGTSVRGRIRRELEQQAATLIQTISRGFLVRRAFKDQVESAVAIQSSIRGFKARKSVMEIKHKKSAVVLQKNFRAYLARRGYQKHLKGIVLVQSYARRWNARKQLKTLKIEAKSVDHLKKLQYNLENKVIELTQSLTDKIAANKDLVKEIDRLKETVAESSEAHETLKKREIAFKDILSEKENDHLTKTESLALELAEAKTTYEASLKRTEELLEQQEILKKEVAENVAALTKARVELESKNDENTSLNETVTRLKTDIDNLRKELEKARSGSVFQQGVLSGNKSMNGRIASVSSEADFELNNKKNGTTRRVSGAYEGTENVSPDDLDRLNSELWSLLKDSKSLHKEIIEGLLKGLKIPGFSVAADLKRKDILFPARAIIIIISDMWRLGLTSESEQFLGQVLAAIQNIVSSLKESDVIAHGAFWLSNTHELYSFVSYAQSNIINNKEAAASLGEDGYNEYLKLVAVVKEDFESLSFNIYNMWMKKMQKELQKKAISALVVSQSLPGFSTPDQSPFLSKVFNSGDSYKMEDILTFFNSLYWSMRTYFIEQPVINEVLEQLLRYIDAICFNDLVMRRNFLSWKRGLQVNYNITRLEEWCKTHGIKDSLTHLIHMVHAAKLLQLRKNTVADIGIIFEICYALKPAQIQKLISQYYVADYETPLAPGVLSAVAERVKAAGSNGEFFQPVNSDGNFEDPFRSVGVRPVYKVEAYIPAWLNLPTLKEIVNLVAKVAMMNEIMAQKQDNDENEVQPEFVAQ